MKFSNLRLLPILLITLSMSSCAFKSIRRHKNIVYMPADSTGNIPQQSLNIFSPRKASSEKVLIFLYGGSWRSGKKNLYNFLGSRMARKGAVTVIVDYPLNPIADYNDMARATASAVKWVHQNVKLFGGDRDRIFISGHSAGGHLATLVTVRQEYFDSVGLKKNPIKGAILIDAAGLDMYGYLMEEKKPEGHSYLKTFTSNPDEWKKASPLYHLREGLPPLLIYKGERTYPSILKSHEKFVKALENYDTNVTYKVLERKKHVPMITQFFWSWNRRYDEIVDFMSSK
jgi:acetyl esterase/lipase